MNKTLSIIIISYNTRTLTTNCIKSVLKDKGLEFAKRPTETEKIPTEIIVIDNNSKDDSVKKLKQFKKTLKNPSFLTIVANKDNPGFGKANNQAINLASGNFILLLNSDTLILHSSISQTLNWLSAHPETGVCTCQLLNPNKTIQPSGGSFPTLPNITTWALHLDDLPFINKLIPPLHPHPPQFYLRSSYYKKTHPQDWVTGAFMLLRKSAFQKSGPFDENFFMYAEELEWCYRIKKDAWQIHYLAGPQIIHLGGQSSKTSENSTFGEYQGLLKFFQLHRPPWQYPIARYLFKINCFVGIFLKALQFKFSDAKIHKKVFKKI